MKNIKSLIRVQPYLKELMYEIILNSEEFIIQFTQELALKT